MVKIRPIEGQDDAPLAQIIRTILKSYGLDIPGTAYFDKELDHLSSFYSKKSNREYFVAVDSDSTVLGGNGIAEFDPVNKIAELQKLYLTDSARGHHLSYRLLDTAVGFAKGAGYQTVYLETHHSLKEAVHLYQEYGFRDLGHPLNNGEHSSMDKFFVLNI
ncbi:GNAT family N-acetyltransferase [Lentilactobacillus otakiensis]|uniref:GNAT family acetyltransferase n=1 Tax=Lentilactobacillus otakiensis DSM 19908 = JCM 15040 TaxID=1423780 RepID=S4NKC6_9LACO|nr:GNAT family N-acetyltransferase [Lentilactobacillus otakiensis]KRL10210.1 N-acetyltransferase GCN5 [Lentilactobacillus otakiensis DSM 19908 = JCM 15040]MBZ3777316.1 GNAT family N-acetyltransferase [Lentilactobacillus otakiensis]MDV3518575.1 GNAT family N-acetyltransferase [Lentilactobacillus otakiensis]GAD16371.1 GNAT family acetyltransferase [Lentilactobacillus otakiensis DSM 19908 = JCM 15040]